MKKIHEIHDSIPVARVTFIFDSKYLLNGMPRFYSPYFNGLGDEFKISKSIENLGRLQLINIFDGTVTTYDYENFKGFKNYGGRGITVCNEWLEDFFNFYYWAKIMDLKMVLN